MGLFAGWQGKITLPPTSLRKESIGGNAVFQQAFRGGCFHARVFESHVKDVVGRMNAVYLDQTKRL